MTITLICNDCIRLHGGQLVTSPHYDMGVCHCCGQYRALSPVSLYRWPAGRPQRREPVTQPCRDEECRICQD